MSLTWQEAASPEHPGGGLFFVFSPVLRAPRDRWWSLVLSPARAGRGAGDGENRGAGDAAAPLATQGGVMAEPSITVYPPDEDGGRRVRLDGTILGRAYNANDLLEFLRRAGLDPDEVDLDGPLIEWRGGGAYAWGPGSGDPA